MHYLKHAVKTVSSALLVTALTTTVADATVVKKPAKPGKETKTTVVNVVPFTEAGDEDIHFGTRCFELAPGQVVIKAEAVVHHRRKSSFSVVSVVQPKKVLISEVSKLSISEAVNSVTQVMTDRSAAARLQLAAEVATFGEVATTPAKICWTAHIEGHKWKGDGRLHASIKVTTQKIATVKDYRDLLFKLTKIQPNTSAAEVDAIIAQLESLQIA